MFGTKKSKTINNCIIVSKKHFNIKNAKTWIGDSNGSKKSRCCGSNWVDVSKMEWEQPKRTNMFIEEQPFSKGGFRSVTKGKTLDKTFVIKSFLPEAIQEIVNLNKVVQKKETTVSLSKKAVQMHKLAANFTNELKKLISNIGKKEEFGETFSYNDIYLGIIRKSEEETVVVEEFIPGEFIKYINNDGTTIKNPATVIEFQLKAECLCHYSYVKSDKKLLLVDIQGSGMTLFDPEIATVGAYVSDGELNFCMGNLSDTAVDMFTTVHLCNLYCAMIGLLPFPTEED